eukprot:TRINITY_DN2964_c0_g2_i4.p1 TRINITY_DN2964_c0_g2~~TRINITY_DN2964_c0_g2_i4.p1  ORF type:complete len:844 (-),score=106.18 TRINITY_DN2964_c0_g2_i4:226-2757(-)
MRSDGGLDVGSQLTCCSPAKGDDSVATPWSERMFGIEKRLAVLEARSGMLDADLEARLVEIVSSQVPQKDQMWEGEEALARKKGAVGDHSEVIVAEDPPEAGICRVMTNEEVEDIYKRTQDTEVSESVWDASLLAFTPASGALGSLFLSILILFNIFIQVVFCSIAWSVFASDKESKFHPGVVEEATVFRLDEAHNVKRMNKASWISLASRVCKLDGALVNGNAQVKILQELNKYTEHFSFCGIFDVGQTGPALAVLCVILWYLTVSQEILKSFDMVNVLCTIAHSGIHSRIVFHAEDKISVEALGWPRRVCLLLLVSLRLVIAVVLLVSGAVWLCLTTNLFDLILNAAALAFVLDCDELIFATMAPPELKRSVKNTVPLKRKYEPRICGLAIRGPLLVLVLIALCFHLENAYIQPVLDRMDQVNASMCGGEQAFVVESSMNLGHAVVVPTETWTLDSSVDSSLLKKATNEGKDVSTEEMVRLAGLPMSLQNKSAMIVGSKGDFDMEIRKTFSDLVSPSCVDEMHQGSEKLIIQPYLESLRFSTGRLDAIKCEDFVVFCRNHSSAGTLVRSFCSKTCGCGTLASFMVNRVGCSAGCLARTQVELSAFSGTNMRAVSACFDQPKEIFSDPKIKLMLEDYEKILSVKLPTDKMQEFGCSVFFFHFIEQAFGPVNYEWVPDVLCGRVAGSNTAIKDLQYQSMRWLCPVACGCTLDFTSDCPKSCRQGPGVFQDDSCALGICPQKTVRNASITPSLSCQDLDKIIRNSSYSQHQCETMIVMAAPLCCCSDARSCGGCSDQLKAFCAEVEYCFGDGLCSFCGASEECKGTVCEGCRAAAVCAPCFGPE